QGDGELRGPQAGDAAAEFVRGGGLDYGEARDIAHYPARAVRDETCEHHHGGAEEACAGDPGGREERGREDYLPAAADRSGPARGEGTEDGADRGRGEQQARGGVTGVQYLGDVLRDQDIPAGQQHGDTADEQCRADD